MGNKKSNLKNETKQSNNEDLLINCYSYLNIGIAGQREVGKSCLLNNFQDKNFSPKYIPTIGK